MYPVVAIIGRPNVGKSTLFNRLLRRQKALTSDMPGVTRDTLEATARFEGRPVRILDTGGLVLENPQGIELGILEQARQAMLSADVVVFVVDGREGLNAGDLDVAELLRLGGKPVLLAANKIDGEELGLHLSGDFHSLGFELMTVSASHGHNIRTLIERLLELLPPETDESIEGEVSEVKPLRLSLIGKPNAGKSSLVNAMLGRERLIVSPEAGTTRDAVDVGFDYKDRRYVFVDTPGVRKKSRIEASLERFSVQAALSGARKADVSILVVDAVEGVTSQDKKLISFLDNEKAAFLVAVNKMDLLTPEQKKELKKDLQEELRICPHVPVLFVSALKRSGLGNLLGHCEKIHSQCQVRIGTGELNRLVREATSRYQPPVIKGRRAKFYYLTQTGINPPTFVFFVNDPERIKSSYAKYLENQLRKLSGISQAPLRVHFRPSHAKKEE